MNRPADPLRSCGRLLLAAAAAALLACAARAGEAGDRGAALFSRLAERSWTLKDPVRSFSPANLYEEIDGEAELFLPYGFRRLTVGYVARASAAAAQFRVEIYRHGSARDAFGIFSQHRFPDQDTVPVGPSEGIVSDGSLDFFRGECFVRIRAASPGASRNDLLDLGRGVAALLEGTGAPPPETAALVGEGYVPGTLVFHRKAILGYDALAPGYEARRSSGKTGVRMLLLVRTGEAEAAPIARVADGRLPGFAKIGPGRYRAEIPGGPLWLLESGERMVGISGEPDGDRAEVLLREAAKKIP